MTVTTPNSVSPQQLELATAVGNKVCAAVQANRERGAENPTLVAWANDPMSVLVENGLPADFLGHVLPDEKSGFLTHLKTERENELGIFRKRQVPRGFFRCWACRIGLVVFIALVGLALSAVTFGAGCAIFIAAVNFMVTIGVAMTVAERSMVAATAAGVSPLREGSAHSSPLSARRFPTPAECARGLAVCSGAGAASGVRGRSFSYTQPSEGRY